MSIEDPNLKDIENANFSTSEAINILRKNLGEINFLMADILEKIKELNTAFSSSELNEIEKKLNRELKERLENEYKILEENYTETEKTINELLGIYEREQEHKKNEDLLRKFEGPIN